MIKGLRILTYCMILMMMIHMCQMSKLLHPHQRHSRQCRRLPFRTRSCNFPSLSGGGRPLAPPLWRRGRGQGGDDPHHPQPDAHRPRGAPAATAQDGPQRGRRREADDLRRPAAARRPGTAATAAASAASATDGGGGRGVRQDVPQSRPRYYRQCVRGKRGRQGDHGQQPPSTRPTVNE